MHTGKSTSTVSVKELPEESDVDAFVTTVCVGNIEGSS